jgi:Flp pilus assembly protein TadD
VTVARIHPHIATLQQAMALHQAGDLVRAMAMYRAVLEEDPKQADALHLLGGAEWQLGNLEEAENLMRRAIAVWDGEAGYFCDLGGVLKAKGSYADAITEYKNSLKIDPANHKARDGLADAYGKYGYELAADYRWEEAEAAYHHLLDLRPDDPAAISNLGEMFQHAGEREKALTYCDRALAIAPGLHIARYNRAICRLALNDLTGGWDDMEKSAGYWLTHLDNRRDLPWIGLPLWDGSDPKGKKILVWGDQGIGDEVLFAGMIPDLIARGARVTIECMDRLAALFERSFPEAEIIVRQAPPDCTMDFDFQAPGLWLGRWLRPNFQSFPARRSYLESDAQKTAALRTRYEALGKKHIIGIAWHSISGGRASHRRMTLMEMVPALPQGDVLYVDLQYGDRRAEIEEMRRTFPDFALYHDETIDQLRDMDSFAAQIKACDRIITIGNTTAHMAGALGVPADVLLPAAGLTWYWFEKRPESPWYPSLKLHRRDKDGDWSAALAGIAG